MLWIIHKMGCEKTAQLCGGEFANYEFNAFSGELRLILD